MPNDAPLNTPVEGLIEAIPDGLTFHIPEAGELVYVVGTPLHSDDGPVITVGVSSVVMPAVTRQPDGSV